METKFSSQNVWDVVYNALRRWKEQIKCAKKTISRVLEFHFKKVFSFFLSLYCLCSGVESFDLSFKARFFQT